MIPEGGVLADVTEGIRKQPSRTYSLNDLQNGGAVGLIDDLEAIKQTVYKILMTNRYEFPIYSPSYGAELSGSIGKNQALMKSELKRQISEALLWDDRITDITDFVFEIDGESALVKFSVVSEYGSFQQEAIVRE